jgi:antitoxin component YwqK of YwqJK toxin-antitoxin module
MHLLDYQSPEQKLLMRVFNQHINTDAKWIALIVESFIYCYVNERVIKNGEIYIGTYRTRFGVPDGVMRCWWPNGTLMVESTYRNDILHGPYTVWSQDGTMIEHFNYFEGKGNCELKKWHLNGQLSLHTTLKNDYYDGIYREWNEHGVLITHGFIHETLRHGQYTQYTSTGSIEWQGFYIYGKHVAEWKWKMWKALDAIKCTLKKK